MKILKTQYVAQFCNRVNLFSSSNCKRSHARLKWELGTRSARIRIRMRQGIIILFSISTLVEPCLVGVSFVHVSAFHLAAQMKAPTTVICLIRFDNISNSIRRVNTVSFELCGYSAQPISAQRARSWATYFKQFTCKLHINGWWLQTTAVTVSNKSIGTECQVKTIN